MVTAFLKADVGQDPSTGWWRVSAFDVDRGHLYMTGASEMTAAFLNVQRLVATQHHPFPVDIVGIMRRTDD